MRLNPESGKTLPIYGKLNSTFLVKPYMLLVAGMEESGNLLGTDNKRPVRT